MVPGQFFPKPESYPLWHLWPLGTLVLLFWILTKGYHGAKVQIFWGQRITFSDNLCFHGTWGHFLNIGHMLLWCQGQFFWGHRVTLFDNLCPHGTRGCFSIFTKGYRGATYPLWQPLTSGDMRLFLRFKFRPKATMIPKDSFLFWGQRVTLSYNLCPLGIEATSWTLAKGYRGAKGQFFPRPVSYPLWQPLVKWGHFSNLVQRLLWCKRTIIPRPENYLFWQPLSSRDMRSFLRFKFSVMPKDRFFQS